MPPTFEHILGQAAWSCLIGLFWLPLGGFFAWRFFQPRYMAIREKGWRRSGATIDLFPDRYKDPAIYAIAANTSLFIKNTTDGAVEIYPGGIEIPPWIRAELPFTKVMLAAGQTSELRFACVGHYHLSVRRLDNLPLPYNHLIVKVHHSEEVAITENGFLTAKTLADLQQGNPRSLTRYTLDDTGKSVSFINVTTSPVQICLDQATGPQELQSPGLLLDPRQQKEVKFDEFGDYTVTAWRTTGQNFQRNQLRVTVRYNSD